MLKQHIKLTIKCSSTSGKIKYQNLQQEKQCISRKTRRRESDRAGNPQLHYANKTFTYFKTKTQTSTLEKFSKLLANNRYSQLFKRIPFLMDKNRTKTLNRKKPFYYHDIINYINNHNKHINKTKIKTKTIYQKITQEGSKQHTITGEIKKTSTRHSV